MPKVQVEFIKAHTVFPGAKSQWRTGCQPGTAQQRFASSPNIVNELEEAQIPRQVLLKNSSMWAKPGAQKWPKTFDGVDMDLVEAVPVFVSGILFDRVANLTETSSHSTTPSSLQPGFVAQISLRRVIVMVCAMSGSRSNSAAIWLLDTLRPMRYSMTIQVAME